MDILLIFLILLIILVFLYFHFKVIYQRKIKDYNNELQPFLRDNNLKLISLSKAKGKDYKFCPFTEPQGEDAVRISFVSLNGFPVFQTEEKYLIATCENMEGEMKTVWIKIFTEYFKEPVVQFRMQRYET